MKFEAPENNNSIIKVIGVGGGGCNAVNHMHREGIKGVDFIICNTDQQSLDSSSITTKIQLGASLTEGRGAGAIAEVGKNAAIESIDEIKAQIGSETKMVFITAGMGGGTGTGAAPVIAATAKEMGILTVGIITIPFAFEGKKRKLQAQQGIEEMRAAVDTLIIICNDRIREVYGNLSITNAFAHADDVLGTAAKGIAEIITSTGSINVDFEDVRTVMSNSGVAIMGSAQASGENRALNAIEEAIASPLLNDNNINGANYILLNITYGKDEIQMDEIVEITDYIQQEAGESADIIWGHGFDESLEENIQITLIATGFDRSVEMGYATTSNSAPKKKVINLNQPIESTKPSPQGYQAQQTTDEPILIAKTEQKPSFSNLTESSEPITENTTQETVTPKNTDEPYIKTQKVIEFEVNEEPTMVATPNSNTESYNKPEPTIAPGLSEEEKQSRIKERLNRLKDLSMKLKAPAGLAELESEPAYKRREIELDDTPSAKEDQTSRYTLSEEDDPIQEGEKKYTLKDNNSFLHDNVD